MNSLNSAEVFGHAYGEGIAPSLANQGALVALNSIPLTGIPFVIFNAPVGHLGTI